MIYKFEEIKKIVEKMTLKEKVGQMCVPILQSDGIPADIETAITQLGVGMIRYCPNANFDNSSVPIGEPNRYLKPSETAQLMNNLQKLAARTRMQIPLLIAVDQEGSTRSDMNRGGAAVYPGHMAFGAIDDPGLTYRAGKACGEELRAMGVNLVQAPIVDVITYNGRKTIKASSFGENVEMVMRHSLALMKGYKAGGLSTMAKHFPGYGSIATDAHKGVAEITKPLEKLEEEDLAPFRELFAAGTDGIMMGHVIAKCLDDSDMPATLSEKVIKGTIRRKMNYNGIVETDAMRMKAIQDIYGTAQASVMAVKAGCDLVLLRGDFDHFMDGYEAILDAAQKGKIPEEEINESVHRILTVKSNLNLFENPYVNTEAADRIVGCEEHRKTSMEIAERSITLLKNKSGLIPFKNNSTKSILVVSVEPQKIGAARDPLQSTDMLICAVKGIHNRTTGCMVSLNPSTHEIEMAVSLAKEVDIVIVGTCNVMIYSSQKRLADALNALGKPLIIVAMESPYDVEELDNVKSCICTYGVSNDSMIAAARVLFNKMVPAGKLPVSLHGLYEKE